MSYIRAEEILPEEIIELIQKYVDGKSIYIPRKKENRLAWGQTTHTRQELQCRNLEIYEDYRSGYGISALAKKYYLSEKSIQRIIREAKSK